MLSGDTGNFSTVYTFSKLISSNPSKDLTFNFTSLPSLVTLLLFTVEIVNVLVVPLIPSSSTRLFSQRDTSEPLSSNAYVCSVRD